MSSVHKAVLLHEVVRGLIGNNNNIIPWYIDGTLGGCGHAIAIAEALKGKVNILGIDLDRQALQRAKEILTGKAEKVILEEENFRAMDMLLVKHGIKEANMILLDLGISSDELENSGKGFSFKKDEPLIMTLGDNDRYYPFTAKDIVNKWEEENIANIIYAYGEEKFSRRIARAIVSYRNKKEIETSAELAEIVRGAVPPFYRRGKIHPATKTFQAIRITVNDELTALKEGLESGYKILAKGGRMAVISFHSLEDRIVKNFYKEKNKEGAKLLNKKIIEASEEEINNNPRARSAKLRIIEKNYDKENK